MKIAVTGATGHIGCNLVRALLAAGHDVRAVVRGPGTQPEHEVAAERSPLAGVACERVAAELADAASLTRAFDGAELVFHLAARISIAPGDEAEVHAVNVGGVRNVVTACLDARVRRLVHFSSIHAFDAEPAGEIVDEKRRLAPDRDGVVTYDRSKANGEREIIAGIERGLDAVVVNPTAVLGPNDFRPSPMGRVLLDLHHRRLPALVDGGFDWVDVRDVVAGAIAAAERGQRGDKFLLSGTHKRVAELAEMVESLTGVRAPRFVSPMWLARAGAPFATVVSRALGKPPRFTSQSLHALRHHQRVSNERARERLGYAPRALGETLKDTFAWFRESGAIA
jgi:dihydroflavonol-4-reductase